MMHVLEIIAIFCGICAMLIPLLHQLALGEPDLDKFPVLTDTATTKAATMVWFYTGLVLHAIVLAVTA